MRRCWRRALFLMPRPGNLLLLTLNSGTSCLQLHLVSFASCCLSSLVMRMCLTKSLSLIVSKSVVSDNAQYAVYTIQNIRSLHQGVSMHSIRGSVIWFAGMICSHHHGIGAYICISCKNTYMRLWSAYPTCLGFSEFGLGKLLLYLSICDNSVWHVAAWSSGLWL